MGLAGNDPKTGTQPIRKPFFGLLIFLLGVIAGSFFAKFQERHVARVNLDAVGADISRAGGRSLFVASTDGFLRQTCSGLCDNISCSFKNRSA